MSPAGRRGVLIGGALLVIAFVVAGVIAFNSGGQPSAADTAQTSEPAAGVTDPATAIQEYLQDFAQGGTDQAAALTDDPKTASAALRDARNSLVPVSVTAKMTKLDPVPAGGTKTQGTFSLGWALRDHQMWTYDSTFSLAKSGPNWLVHWAPALLHPKLEAGQRLEVVTGVPDTPVVVDAANRPLVVNAAGGTPRAADPAVAPLLQSALVSRASATHGAGFTIQRTDTSGKSLETLFGQAGGDAVKPAVSSVNIDVQRAAQSTVDGYSGSAVMVVIQPSTGDIQAVAQNSVAGTEPKALSGQYSPGSTFKIATATAALEGGLATPDSALPCPLSDQIGTRTLKNEGFDLGTVPMHKAFAHSCNTTFGRLASQLPPDGLVNAAGQFGLNADFSIPGLTTEAGKVTAASGNDALVECGIGQGPAVEVSPFGEALMAATVAAGKAVTPRLWHDADTQVTTGYHAPSAAVIKQLRGMMREVVTAGTAKGLAGSGPVFGKTGTAQFGTGETANGWFVGYRGDLAFAILLEGSNDSKPAVSLAAKFLAH